MPPAGYPAAVRRICTDSRVLFLADEIQSGRDGKRTTFACEREDVVPDVHMLGKALVATKRCPPSCLEMTFWA